MKFIGAFFQVIILCVVAWFTFGWQYDYYKSMASADQESLTKRFLSETRKDEKGIEVPVCNTYEEASSRAKSEIKTGKSVSNAGSAKVLIFRVAHLAVSAIIGFLAFFCAYFMVYVTTFPLTSFLDSPMGNFNRFFVGPLVMASVGGGFVVFLVAAGFVQML